MKIKNETKKTSNATVYNRLKRHDLSCPLCRPHKNENKGRCPKHGTKKPRYKDHRR